MSKKKRRDRSSPRPSPEVSPLAEGLGEDLGLPELHARRFPIYVGVAVFLIYLKTLHPSVAGGDSGELITAPHTWGVVHPPGYPIFTLLAKLFTLIPIGQIGWRVNLLSALCGAAAAGVLALAVQRWTRSPGAALLASGVFAFAPLTWHYSVVAEVFSLNSLLMALLAYFAIRFSESREPRWAAAIAAVSGAGAAHHHTLVFFAAPVIAWVAWLAPAQTIASLPRLAGYAFLPMLTYAYLPIADSFKPLVTWGNPSTWEGFWSHFLRKEYGTFSLGTEANFGKTSQLWTGLKAYFTHLPTETLGVLWVPAIGGAAVACAARARRALPWVLAGATLAYLGIFHHLSNLTLENPLFRGINMRFWILPNLMFAFFAGIGFAKAESEVRRLSPLDYFPGGWSVGRLALATAGILVFLQLALHWKECDRSKDYQIFRYGKALIGALPPDALLLSKGDLQTNAIRYAQHCENFRKDVRVMDREMLTTPWFKRIVEKNYPDVVVPGRQFHPQHPEGYNWLTYLNANARFRAYLSNWDYYEHDKSWADRYRMFPMGILNGFAPKDRPFDVPTFIRETEPAFSEFTPELVADLSRFPDGTWEILVIRDYWEALYRRGYFLIEFGVQNGDMRLALEKGAELLEDILKRSPSSPPFLYKNLGIAHSKLEKYDPSHEERKVRLWRKYVANPPGDDRDVFAIRKILEGYQGRFE